MPRSRAGRETGHRLLEWDRGSTDAERLAGQLLRVDGYAAIDPSHPLGGPDGLKDVKCLRGDEQWIAGAYFPRGQQTQGDIKAKLLADVEGVKRNGAAGIAFVTNQELTLGDREALAKDCPSPLDLFHLERVASLLDSPQCYGIRLDFLDIEMTKEEQLAFYKGTLSDNAHIRSQLAKLMALLHDKDFPANIPSSELAHFRAQVFELIGHPSLILGGPIDRLRPPLAELREYERIVGELTGHIGRYVSVGGPIDRLRPPTQALQEYEEHLDRILAKLHALRALPNVEE